MFKADHLIVLGRPHPNGGRYLNTSLEERERFRSALTEGISRARAAGDFATADTVRDVLARVWLQVRPPFEAYITHEEWLALSRALRYEGHSDSKAYGLLVHRRQW